MPDETNEESVARYYDTAIFEAELVRLTRDCPVERAITLRWLERLAPANAEIAEIGVGGGIYSEFLARKGCRLHLVDVSARLLDAVAARLRAAGLGESIAGISRESATCLDSLPAGAFDTVLMLGPMYHLCTLEARRTSVRRGDQPPVLPARFLPPFPTRGLRAKGVPRTIPARRQSGSGARAAHRLRAFVHVCRVSRVVCARVRRVGAGGRGVLQHGVAAHAERFAARGGRGVAGPD